MLLVGWLASFAIAGAAGMAEFYMWSYDYGHNLADDAVIKVPGMSYQPPLIGSKQLLNFTADSWPAAGSWLAFAAFALGIIALWPLAKRLQVAAPPRAAATSSWSRSSPPTSATAPFVCPNHDAGPERPAPRPRREHLGSGRTAALHPLRYPVPRSDLHRAARPR